MRIILFKQGAFGGTDLLLDRYYKWLKDRRYEVDDFDFSKDSVKSLNKHYDLAIVPASQMGEVYRVFHLGVKIVRMLVWIMGAGAFYEAYFNPGRIGRINKVVNDLLKREADKTLKWLWTHNSICFTDIAGICSSVEKTEIAYERDMDERLLPIAVEIPPKKIANSQKEINDPLRLAWIGRVSSDFKEIPIAYMINDICNWEKITHKKIVLTIVGTGDALPNIKNIAQNSGINITFIENIAYEKLGNFVQDNVDLLFAMGTSAIDGAKVGCPTVVVTPVRPTDEKKVSYRWIFESNGFSLGEYPELSRKTNQMMKTFESIMNEYYVMDDLGDKSYEYSKNFDNEVVFQKLYSWECGEITSEMKKHLKFFYYLKALKSFVKRIQRTCSKDK